MLGVGIVRAAILSSFCHFVKACRQAKWGFTWDLNFTIRATDIERPAGWSDIETFSANMLYVPCRGRRLLRSISVSL
jgi:hypothetical protein